MASFIWMAFQQDSGASLGERGFVFGFMVFFCVMALVSLAAAWTVFTKAGEPGWACLVPIYNLVVLCRIGGKSGWWALLTMIPLVGAIFYLIVCIGVANGFGKGVGYGLGLFFLPFIFFPMLAFGDATYQGAA